jgi:hypothetical protein
MTPIRIWADTYSTGLIDEDGASVPREQTTVSERTWADLRQWVADYDAIIPMGQAQREQHASRIDELDRRGMALLRRVRSEWPADAEGKPVDFRYDSEGLMRFVR